ncbi:phenylacetate--CoA ligase family protein [Natrialbaceae archaeon A-chndr2]
MKLYDCYGQHTLEQLQDQLERYADVALYEDVFSAAGLEPGAITSWEDFRSLPLTTTEDLLADVESNPPTGSLHEEGAMISFTPAKDSELPVFETPGDITRYAEVHGRIFERLGMEPGMRAMVAFGYHGFGTGYLLHRALEYNGIEVIPAGPGDSEAKAARIDEFDVDVLWANPSFALEVAEHGGESLDIFIGGGEPFTSVDGRREQVHEAFGDLECAVDCFGLRQAWPVALECAAECGLHVVDDYMIVEIVEPETGDVLPLGERGEVVLTHLDREAGGMLRYRTGDLSVLEEGSSPHVDGSTVMMPQGVFGRTDEMHKIKGVKVYPQGIPLVLGSFDGLNPFAYRLTISSDGGSDYLAVTVEGEVDERALEDALADRLLVRPDEVTAVDDLEDGPAVVDERY